MRKTLAREEGKRKKFQAIFERLGKKINYKGYSEETILLKNVIDLETKTVATDHLWFAYTKGFQKLTLQPGALIEFEARVKEYVKGYVNKSYRINQQQTDYKLSHPTKIKLIILPESGDKNH